MNGLVLMALLLMEADTPRTSTVTGTLQRLKEVWSPQLENRRELLVWLPPGYRRSRARYPVVYLQDGQNVFDAATSFSGREWHADEAGARLAARGLPLILVGIANAGEARLSEYGPFAMPRLRAEGRGDRYVAFLADTVKPMIDARFRTDPSPARTAVVGSSMGAIASLTAALSRSDAFGLAGVHSPSVWVADRALLRWVREHPAPAGLRAWVDMGTEEGKTAAERRAGVADARALAALLTAQGAAVRLEIAKGARHHEDAWAARLEPALEWLYEAR